MATVVTCRCGGKFRVPDGTAGKSVACPKCGETMKVPASPITAKAPARTAPPAAPVTTRAPARPSSAGKRYQCVECGGSFPAAEILDDDGEYICRDCADQGKDDRDDEDREGEDTSRKTGIEVQATFFPLFFTLFLLTPGLEIDGRKVDLGWWSKKYIRLRPGRHEVRMYLPSLFGPVGTHTREVRVRPGHTPSVHYTYYTWWFASMSVRD